MRIVYFHRNKKAGYSLDIVAQTIVSRIDNKQELYVPEYRSSVKSILSNLWFVFKHRDTKSICHITGDIHYCILALIGCDTVLTIHDIGSFQAKKMNRLKRGIIEVVWYYIPLIFAKRIICISEETKREIKKYTKRNDIYVIHNAVNPSFLLSNCDPVFEEMRVLIIGTSKNKNLENSIKALKGIKCELTIIGTVPEEILNLMTTLSIKYRNLYNLTDEQVYSEYKRCHIVSFVSFYEGFGMPVIEANAVGRPVVCSNIPVLKEVGGEGAIYVDPYNIEEIHNAYMELYSDKLLRKDMISKGLKNVERFRVENILPQWKLVYNSFVTVL